MGHRQRHRQRQRQGQRHLRTIARGEAYDTPSSRTSGSAPDPRKAPARLMCAVASQQGGSSTHIIPPGPLSSAKRWLTVAAQYVREEGVPYAYGIARGETPVHWRGKRERREWNGRPLRPPLLSTGHSTLSGKGTARLRRFFLFMKGRLRPALEEKARTYRGPSSRRWRWSARASLDGGGDASPINCAAAVINRLGTDATPEGRRRGQ